MSAAAQWVGTPQWIARVVRTNHVRSAGRMLRIDFDWGSGLGVAMSGLKRSERPDAGRQEPAEPMLRSAVRSCGGVFGFKIRMNTEWAEVWASLGRVDRTRGAGAVAPVQAIEVRALQGATIYGMQTRGFVVAPAGGVVGCQCVWAEWTYSGRFSLRWVHHPGTFVPHMNSDYVQLLDATIQHLEQLRADGVEFVPVKAATLAALAAPVKLSIMAITVTKYLIVSP